MSIPYTGFQSLQLEKRIRALCKRVPCIDVRVVQTTSRRIGQMFHFKDRLPLALSSGVVYRFQCGNCDVSYIGETKRHLGVRACEHLATSWRTGTPVKGSTESAILAHCRDTGHGPFSVNDFSILHHSSFVTDLRILESIEIKMRKPELNKDVSSVFIHTV